jgi:creatinine amidohydrolase
LDQLLRNPISSESAIGARASIKGAPGEALDRRCTLRRFLGAWLHLPDGIQPRVETYVRLIHEILDSLAGSGFRRVLIVNGHGGNQPAQAAAIEWMADHPAVRVKFHNWWNAPRTFAKVQEIDPVASHASWMENFPWTRLAGSEPPKEQKPMIDMARMRLLDPKALRDYLVDGNFGGYYQRPDEDMQAIWAVAVAETRELLQGPWQ